MNSLGNQTRLMSWYWKQKPTWRKDLITVIHGLSFLLIVWLLTWRGRGISFEIGRPRSRWLKNFGHSWTRGLATLENYTILMDVIRVSGKIKKFFFPLIRKTLITQHILALIRMSWVEDFWKINFSFFFFFFFFWRETSISNSRVCTLKEVID